jgi:hypothetical protein
VIELCPDHYIDDVFGLENVANRTPCARFSQTMDCDLQVAATGGKRCRYVVVGSAGLDSRVSRKSQG